ncbi:MAG: VWA domain-containing protein [Planctomycetaceae bacterium]
MNAVRSFLLRIFPPPRKPVRWIDAWPLVLFLAIFAGLVFWLEASGRMLFERPAWFGLLAVTPWIWWMSVAGAGGLPAGRAATATLIRLSLAGLLVMVLAEPRSVRKSDRLSVVYAMDISDSIGETTSEAARTFFARTVSQKPSDDEAGLVVFGRNAAVEFPPRKSTPPNDTAINSLIEPDATNIEQALSLAAAMLPEETRGRIVLVSDGTSTEGSLSRVLDELKSRGIVVDVLPIQYDFKSEVWLERLELPRQVKLGENYEASIVLASLAKGKGKLVLRENGEVIAEREVEFEAGKNRFSVPIALREPAYYEYAATIETAPDDDHLKQNNTVVSYLFVEGEGKVLLVTSPEADDREWQRLAKTLRDADRLVDHVVAYDLPRDVLSLMPYDCIVFVNAPADAFDAVQMQAVHDSIKNLGIGFVMVGGEQSYGPGGYHRTVIEDALPVSMDVTKRKVLPKAALAVILHTCEFPEGNTWGKRITKEAIRVLGAQDEVGVLAYDAAGGGEKWIFELTPAGDYAKMVPKINAAEIGDMPSFQTTMQLGLEGLKANDAATKHMIIISDGDPSPAPPELVSAFIEAKISVSTVAIFPHGGAEISNLRAVAMATGGRYYFPDDPNTLPAIFIKEAKTLKRSMIQNKTVQPEFEFGVHPILKGIDALPPLHGYVLVSPKGKPAQTLLKVPSDEKVAPGEVDPILSVWQYGLGRSAAFTSDLSANWGRDWIGWEKFQPFVKQLIQHVSRVEKQGHLRVSTETEGNTGVIIAEDFHPEEMFLDVTATVIGPRDRSETVTLRQVGPRRYQAKMPLWGEGRYQVMVKGRAGERTEQVPAGFIVPYSPEYLRFRSSRIVLDEIARKTGGQVLESDATAEDIFPQDRLPKSSSNPVFDWFLVALACLLPLDIAVRRVQLDWKAIAGAFRFRKAEGSGETMGRLLDRKREVREGFTPPKTPRPSLANAATTVRPKREAKPQAAKSKPAPQSRKAAPKPAGDGTTTSRLLERKRQRDQQNPDEPKP